MSSSKSCVNRRQFLQAAGSVAALTAAGVPRKSVSIVSDPADEVAAAPPAQWAASELQRALEARGIAVRKYAFLSEAGPQDFCLLVAGAKSSLGVDILKRSGTSAPDVPEALALIPDVSQGRRVLLALGHDPRGLSYALMELADRVLQAADVFASLTFPAPVTERPANSIRSVTRLFTSDVEDKPWYNDREMWPAYLTMLATQRFNRFSLGLGLGHDFLRQVTDAYFLFAYPFLVDVPGYPVRVPQLPDTERDSNLAMLKYISDQTAARGLHFQLGIWMHGYQWIDSPHPNYTVEGLTPETHGPYCRDALSLLLQSGPSLSGVTFRIHGESGVEEGSFDFWKTVFDGAVSCGRKVEIDMHAKGMTDSMLQVATATGLPLRVSPKFWAEHFGMSYHQADIRELERPKPGQKASALMKFSGASRSFLRYGYGDLLREDRSWGVLHRVWPGTQRILLWGDPVNAAAYSRAFSFCGSDGVEICEPLSFKGRRGSGVAGDRCGYADVSLRPRWDWEKYEYGHRVWGRFLYNPDAQDDVWLRYLRTHFGAGALDLAGALAHASRILPTITTAHGPSAANNSYWPEMYFNQSIIDAEHPGPYTDTLAPKVFGNVSPFDPELFSRINDFADELLGAPEQIGPSGKYSPVEVAQWLEEQADRATNHLTKGASKARRKKSPEYRRLAIDVAMQAGLGRFFAAKFRSAILYRLYERTGSRAALAASVDLYRQARAAWADLAGKARGIYMADVTVGEYAHLRGHWLDRLPAIDRDISALEEKLKALDRPGANKAADLPADNLRMPQLIQQVLSRPRREASNCRHTPPATFTPGQPLQIRLALAVPAPTAGVTLHYRHVNQAERFTTAPMEPSGDGYTATIPANYTGAPYPLQYYFKIRKSKTDALLYPGFAQGLTNQPYFVVRRA
ncbi:MAG: hypothetical protein NVS9B4_20120 [Candidatus Acidiferrum sp.]